MGAVGLVEQGPFGFAAAARAKWREPGAAVALPGPRGAPMDEAFPGAPQSLRRLPVGCLNLDDGSGDEGR